MTAAAKPVDLTDRFAAARAVADAVLYEGYVLYPYRASAPKNQVRWQFGVLAPRSYAEATGAERWRSRTECVLDAGAEPRLSVRVRCLQLQRRTVERTVPGTGFVEVDELVVDGRRVVPWEEAVEHDVDVPRISLLPFATAARVVPIRLPGDEAVEELRAASGELVGRISRRTEPIDGSIALTVDWAEPTGVLMKLGVTVSNDTEWTGADATRDDALRRSLIAVHILLAVDDGAFRSLLDPPADAHDAVAACRNEGTYPVLIGDDESVVLSSPIILYDHPEVAPESEGPLYDATEIDEILALRVLTLTDDEKAEARATDPRAAAIVDRIEGMAPEAWGRLHGTMRELRPVDPTPAPNTNTDRTTDPPVPWWEPAVDAAVDPWTDVVVVAGVEVCTGSSVRLHPSHRADAHDMFLAGMIATVAGVFRDVDGDVHVAVTVDDDPATEALLAHGRYLFFHPDEVEPLDVPGSAA